MKNKERRGPYSFQNRGMCRCDDHSTEPCTTLHTEISQTWRNPKLKKPEIKQTCQICLQVPKEGLNEGRIEKPYPQIEASEQDCMSHKLTSKKRKSVNQFPTQHPETAHSPRKVLPTNQPICINQEVKKNSVYRPIIGSFKTARGIERNRRACGRQVTLWQRFYYIW